MADNNLIINRVFTKNVINELLKTGHSKIFDIVVQRYIDNPEAKNYGQIISEIYSHLGESYRNEYYYTNTLLNKLLVGIHNVNTTTALSQIRISNHIADFVMINGEGHVYEIKSDLDNFERLNDQLYDYFKAFNKVSVLVAEHERTHVEEVMSKLGDMGDSVGIYVLSSNDTIFSKSTGRDPKQYNENLDHECIFSLLRKCEYEAVIQEHFDELPKVKPVFYYKECLKMFKEIPIFEAQKLALNELKKRNKISKMVFEQIPFELKSVLYFANFGNKTSNLETLLNATYRR